MTSTRHPSAIRFSSDDVDAFSRASGDRNPLHISAVYARKTPFGEPVIYGVLIVLDAICKAKLTKSGRLSRLKAEFMHPVYVDTPYDMIETTDDDEKTISICEGRQEHAHINLCFGNPLAESDFKFESEPVFPLGVAQNLNSELVATAGNLTGQYSPDGTYVADFISGVQSRTAIAHTDIAALMACSYIVGMEMPGQQALIRSISLNFDAQSRPLSGKLQFSAMASKIDKRFGLATIEIHLTIGDQPLARGEVSTIIRPQNVSSRRHGPQPQFEKYDLRNRVIVLIGGSRGIGAALAQAFTWCGATVISVFQQCTEDAQLIQESVAGAPGIMQLAQGDATDANWCLHLKEQILKQHGRVDALVCNACPSIRGTRFSAATVNRINSYVTQSLALIDIPMAAFMDTLVETGGTCVVMSSQALENKPSDWPHYVAAKAAAEALIDILAKQNRQVGFLKVRPPKVLTDQMNTHLGRLGAMEPERIAEVIVCRVREMLLDKSLTQEAQTLRDF